MFTLSYQWNDDTTILEFPGNDVIVFDGHMVRYSIGQKLIARLSFFLIFFYNFTSKRMQQVNLYFLNLIYKKRTSTHSHSL